MILVLFGPPGAGKGTQSKLIAKKFNLSHVSTGDLLRTAIKAQSALGVEAKKFVDKGSLVPDSVMIGLIEELIEGNPKAGFLFDGFPRTVEQAGALDQMLKKNQTSVSRAVFLEVSRSLLKDRLSGRRVCVKCGTTFHITLKPPRTTGVCDVCGGTLEQRKDDHESVIDNRLEVYDKNTLPLKSYYQNAQIFQNVDGVGEPSQVFDRICAAVK